MGQMRLDVASTVGDEVLRALQEMSRDYVRRAGRGELPDASHAEAAKDAMTLQDKLHRMPPMPSPRFRSDEAQQEASKRSDRKQAPQNSAPTTVAPPRTPRRVRPHSAKRSAPPPADVESPQTGIRPTASAPPVASSRPSRAVNGTAKRRDLLPSTEGLPLILRRNPAAVLAEAKKMNAVQRDHLLSVVRAAMGEVHRGTFPTRIARPASDRAHQLLKGVERLQFTTSPARLPAGSKSSKKKRKKSRRGQFAPARKLSGSTRSELNAAAHAKVAEARTARPDEDETLLLPARGPLFRAYGVPVSGGLPGLGRRN